MRYGRGEARTWVRANLRGYMTVLYTPFDAAGEIDEAGLRHNVEETLRRPGVGGLSVNSIHQEFWTFTHDERRRLVDIVLETRGFDHVQAVEAALREAGWEIEALSVSPPIPKRV